MNKKDKVATALVIIAICILISAFYLYTYKKVGKIYQDETQNAIIDIRKSFLKNTVDNLIFEIELTRENEAEIYKRYIVRRYETLILEDHLTEKEFVDYFIERFNLDLNKDSYLNYWTIFLWDNTSNQVIYDPENIVKNDINDTLEEQKSKMSYYKVLAHGGVSGFIGVSQDFIDNRIKSITADKIRELKFDNGSYIWVNEVINYDGGKDYAIRRVHPNLPETEGMLLSTEMTDVKGNLPYLEELEGVKKDGELFLNYYFKELNSDVISEKLSFMKLYKDFDWIIGMGVPIDDIQQYIAKTNEKSNEIATNNISLFLFFLVMIVFLSLGFLIWFRNWHFTKEKNMLELENSKDILTATFTRKYGITELNKAFYDFKKYNVNSAIMMFDIDNFKNINDTYGHDVGDEILKEMVITVSKNIRNTDKLIRWGGDEFVGICYGLNKKNVLGLGQKLLLSVSSMKIPSNPAITTTISIGFSYFEENDKDINDVIKRADMAMYKSKQEGRNTVSLL